MWEEIGEKTQSGWQTGNVCSYSPMPGLSQWTWTTLHDNN